MADPHGCSELRRLDKAEDAINDVKVSLIDIKDVLYTIDKDFNSKLTDMADRFTKFFVTMETIAVKTEERDRRNSEIFQENKSSFERYGKRIDELEGALGKNSTVNAQQDLKIGTLEKVLYGGLTSLSALGIWILDSLLDK